MNLLNLKHKNIIKPNISFLIILSLSQFFKKKMTYIHRLFQHRRRFIENKRRIPCFELITNF